MESSSINWSFRVVKIADIIYTTIISALVIIVFVLILQRTLFVWINQQLDNLSGKYVDVHNASILTGVFIVFTSMYAVLSYIIRNIIECIPSPFDGMYGFEHHELKEIFHMTSVIFPIVIAQTHMHSKLIALFDANK